MLMFSEKAMLLCEVLGNKYEVINGAWTGVRDGDLFYIEGDEHSVVEITDWKQFTREEFNAAYPNFGY